MSKCPFMSVHKVTREIRYDSEGRVSEEKEIPSQELKDCLESQCEIYDQQAGKCSLPAMEGRGLASGGDELISTLKAILAETKEARENAAAAQLHVLKKAETTNEILIGLKEKTGEPAGIDLGPLQSALSEMKAALDLNQAKFGDILELMLEDQQKRAAEGGGLQEALAPLLQNAAEIKEALAASQSKFTDILELILEDQQKRASQGDREAELLAEISQKQERVAEALGRGLNADSLNEGLSRMTERSEEYLKSLSEADAVRQARLEQVEQQLIKLQQSILELIEGQRNEQRDVSNERRRQRANEHNDRGVMLFHRRELAAAEAEFRKALDIRPDFAEACNNLGLTLSDLGKKDEAVAAFRKAIELSPDAPEAYNNLGCLYRIRKDYQQAVELFNQAIAKREDYSLAYFNLGVAYEELEKFDLAIKAWERVLSLQPTHEEARRKLASYRARR